MNTIDTFWKLTVCMASERCWFLLHHTHTLPEALAGILDKRPAASTTCMERIVQMSQVVLAAEETTKDPSHPERVAT